MIAIIEIIEVNVKITIRLPHKILIISRKSYRVSTCSYLFLIIYGLLRIFSESFREPDPQVGYIFEMMSMGTLLSSLMILVGIFIFFKRDDIK